MLKRSLALGLLVLLLSAIVYAVALRLGSEGEARALAFMVIVDRQPGVDLRQPLPQRELSRGSSSSPTAVYWWIAALTGIALGTAIYLPSAAAIFQFAQPSLAAVLVVIVASVSLVLASGVLLRNR